MIVQIRNRAFAWRPLGYVPNERVYYSEAQIKQFTPQEKQLRYQQAMFAILASVKEAQKEGALDNVMI